MNNDTMQMMYKTWQDDVVVANLVAGLVDRGEAYAWKAAVEYHVAMIHGIADAYAVMTQSEIDEMVVRETWERYGS